MAAYVLVDVSVHDAVAYEEYKKLTPAAVAAYNGRFIVRGGQSETLEGAWAPERMVVLEFPTVELAKGAAKVVDRTYDGKVAPNGRTVYITEDSRYYWVNKKGKRQYVQESQLKDKNS